jgi:nucleoside-diphosphate-sugar epimerase
VVDNLSTGFRHNLEELSGRIDFIEGDICEPDVCAEAAADVEVIFHVAALPSVPRSMADPLGTHDANVNGTLHLLEAARRAGVRRFVYSSSSSAYGDTPALPKVESMEPLPRSPYAAAKLSGELYALAYARAGLLEAVALRYFNVFGPRQDPMDPTRRLFRSSFALC